MISAHVTIDGERFHIGEGLNSIELTKEYGFIASGVVVDMDTNILHSKKPGILRRKPRERVPLEATILFDDGAEQYAGFLEENSGSESVLEEAPQIVTLNSRSVLSLLLDEVEGGKNRITKSYFDKKWGHIVADVVKLSGFGTRLIEPSTVSAGERTNNSIFLLVVDNQLPGEIITQAVAATGFVANTNADMEFFFTRDLVLPQTQDQEFFFQKGSTESNIRNYSFSTGLVTSFRSQKHTIRMEPGSSVRLDIRSGIQGGDFLSGRYFVTQSRYVKSIEDSESLVAFNVAEELPDLTGTS